MKKTKQSIPVPFTELAEKIFLKTLHISTYGKRNPRINPQSKTKIKKLQTLLLDHGFHMSKQLRNYLYRTTNPTCKKYCDFILNNCKKLIGANINHNVYFKEFPKNVPDQSSFILGLLTKTLQEKSVNEIFTFNGAINLLSLTDYGKYLHSFEEMMESQPEFFTSGKDRLTVIHLGDNFTIDSMNLFFSLLQSKVPLNNDDLDLIKEIGKANPDEISGIDWDEFNINNIIIKENLAIYNSLLMQIENDNVFDNTKCFKSYTDILRCAIVLSDGDVSLTENTKFKSFSRKFRYRLVKSFVELSHDNNYISTNPGDIVQYKEQFKRLCERLHPYDFKNQIDGHFNVFKKIFENDNIQTWNNTADAYWKNKKYNKYVKLLSERPGMLFRNMDKILRLQKKKPTRNLIDYAHNLVNNVSTKVLVESYLHLYQQNTVQSKHRIFQNKKGSVYYKLDERPSLVNHVDKELLNNLSNEITDRVQLFDNVIIEEDLRYVAIPTSAKQQSSGFQSFPAGSIHLIKGNVFRYFVYWKQKNQTTDFDLSGVALHDDFTMKEQISFTNIRGNDIVHSGDITSAYHGATEFINIDLNELSSQVKYIIPTVNVYSGEGFDEVEENFFGYMVRDGIQEGAPFEPKTVRSKIKLSGENKVALPFVLIKDHVNNQWVIKWLNYNLKGRPNYNQVENNINKQTAILEASTNKAHFLLNEYAACLALKNKITGFRKTNDVKKELKNRTGNNLYIGLEKPVKLPDNFTYYGLNDLYKIWK